MKFKLSIPQKLVVKIKKLLWILAEHAFFSFLVFCLFILILGGLIFYKYSILVERKDPEILEKTFQFEEKVYQEILEEWVGREEEFKKASEKEHSDPFQGPEEETPMTETENDEEEPLIYFILEKETLWGLADRYLGSGKRWREITNEKGEIFTENAAEILQPGQKLIIPPK